MHFVSIFVIHSLAACLSNLVMCTGGHCTSWPPTTAAAAAASSYSLDEDCDVLLGTIASVMTTSPESTPTGAEYVVSQEMLMTYFGLWRLLAVWVYS